MNYRSMADHGVILSGATDLPMLIPDVPEAIYYGCGTYAADGKEPVQPEKWSDNTGRQNKSTFECKNVMGTFYSGTCKCSYVLFPLYQICFMISRLQLWELQIPSQEF